MKHIYPKFYDKFKCTAGKCPDSCCKDWDIEVDDRAQEFYESAGGEFGKKLKRLTEVDGDGDRIFVSQNGKCPFWNDKRLCDIYINLGEEHLCDTCKKFPRITQNYSVFAEHMLSFACPEAARLMLSEKNAFARYETRLDTVTEDFDCDLMRFLLKARKITFEIFGDGSLDFSSRLRLALQFNSSVQDLLCSESYDSGLLKKPGINNCGSSEGGDCKFIFSLHKKLDIMSGKWRDLLDKTERSADLPSIHGSFDDEFSVTAQYYVYRYYLTALDSLDVLSTIKRIVCCCVVVGKAEDYLSSVNGGISFEERTRLLQRYSKEVEHSYENSEMLEEEFFTNPDFSTENLMKILD